MISKLLCALVFLSLSHNLHAVSVGSNTAVSRQTSTIFPNTDSDNTMLGFASFEGGVALEDSTTSCTHNGFFPVSSALNIAGGTLVLNKDLVLDSAATFDNVGTVMGNSYSITFKTPNPFTIPCVGAFSLKPIASATLLGPIEVIDWSFDNKYLAAVTDVASGNELQLYYFDGVSLTATAGSDLKRLAASVRWHPSKYYVAAGRNSGDGGFNGHELLVFSFGPRPYQKTGGADISNSNVLAVAWHPGGNYLVSGGAAATSEITLFTFNQSTGAITLSQNVDLSPSRAVTGDSLTWSPGGNYMAAGLVNDITAGANELVLYSFAGTLTSTLGADLGYDLQALDWSPTGTFIAIGLASGSGQTLRIYEHRAWNGTLVEATSARVGYANPVWGCQWDVTGNFLYVGSNSGTGPEGSVYYFDKTAKTLSRLIGRDEASSVNSTRWTQDGRYVAYCTDATADKIAVEQAIFDPPMTLQNVSLYFETDVTFNTTLYIKGNCKINTNGRKLQLSGLGSLIVRPGANLIIEDAEVAAAGTNFRCMNNAASMTLRNTKLNLSGDYTFSQGSLLFDKDVYLTGTQKFIYSTPLTSTISSYSTLFLETGLTFSYAPLVAKRNLLYMPDSTAWLYCDGCTLFSTRTGLQLSTGFLMIDNTVTISSQAKYIAEALTLSSNLNLKILNGGYLALNGLVRYD